MHLTDPSSIKQKSLCECGFSRINMGRDANISDFWHILLSKKETLLCVCPMYTAMPNKQIDSGLAWSVLLLTMIFIITEVKFAADSRGPARWISRNFWALWWQTSLSRDHAKPLSIPFYHNNDVKQDDSFSDKGTAWQVDASSIGKLANQIATLLLIMEKMFGKYSWHPVIKNSLISRACIYQWKLRKKSKFSLINVSSSWK